MGGTQRTSPAPIVVGVDGSSASVAALHWAAAEASAHRAPLVVVHVHDPRNDHRANYAQYSPYPPQDEDSEEQVAAVEQSLSAPSTRRVERVFEVGVPSEVLVRRSEGAQMLVLGQADHHRHPGEVFRDGPALGSIARACVARAGCAVVVVPIPAQQPAPEAEIPDPHRMSELVGGRAIYPRVRATSVVRN